MNSATGAACVVCLLMCVRATCVHAALCVAAFNRSFLSLGRLLRCLGWRPGARKARRRCQLRHGAPQLLHTAGDGCGCDAGALLLAETSVQTGFPNRVCFLILGFPFCQFWFWLLGFPFCFWVSGFFRIVCSGCDCKTWWKQESSAHCCALAPLHQPHTGRLSFAEQMEPASRW